MKILERWSQILCTSAFTVLLAASAGAQTPQPPYPPFVPAPPENQTTPAKVVLGKMLFWDEQLSSDNTVACGTCHIPASGGSDPRSKNFDSKHPGPDMIYNTADDINGSRGVRSAVAGGAFVDDGLFFPDLQRTGKKSPSALDAMFFQDIFWDGRATSQFVDPETGQIAIMAGGALESQAVGPPLSDVEMAHQNRNWSQITSKLTVAKPMRLASNIPADILNALAANPTYPDLFNAAFGSSVVTARHIAFAIASYERTLTSNQTPWDAFNAGNTSALTPAEQRGLAIFMDTRPPGIPGAGRCAVCHPAPFFSDDDFRALALTDQNSDPGRGALTGNPFDLGKFKTPSLRNVGLREAGGLFHHGGTDGRTLSDVVQYYEAGLGNFPGNIDVDFVPIFITTQQRNDLIAFLRNGLTDPRAAMELPPFDRPTLYSERQNQPGTANPRVIVPAFASSQGATPQMLADQPPSLQNDVWTIGLAGALGGTPAWLATGIPNTGANVEPPFMGLTYAVRTAPLPLVTQVMMNGTPLVHGDGWGSASVAIPNFPNLAGFSFAMQWIVPDDGGIRLSASEGIEVTIMP